MWQERSPFAPAFFLSRLYHIIYRDRKQNLLPLQSRISEKKSMKRNNWILGLAIAAIVLSLTTICLQIFVFAKQKPSAEQEYRNMITQHLHHFSAPLPESLTLCGESVPLDNVFVREALDRELTSIMYQHNSTFLILKRSFRFLPEIERLLAKENAPDDLKYLAVAESALSDVTSPAKASGFWQFMPTTAKEYGLEVTNEWDERYDLPKATKAAVKYLTASKSRLGSWALACAAYNCGENGLRQRMKQQNCNNYWELSLNSETSRYVYRILAYKILMENPRQYGFNVRKKDCYQPLEYREVVIDSTITDMAAFAQKIGCSYKYFRLINPCVRSNKLTNKTNKKYTFRTLEKDSFSWAYLVSKLDNPEEFLD